MINIVQNKIKECEDCYKIRCRHCGWEPDKIQLTKVLSGKIKVCPICGKAP